MIRFCVLSIAAAALTACALGMEPPRTPSGIRVPSTAQRANADYGAYPAQYDAIIRAWYAAHLHDPRSARFGTISPPIREHIIVNRRPIFGYAVCAEVDAKNRAGAYSGMQRRWFFLRDHVIRRVREPRGEIYIGHPFRCEESTAERDGG